MSARLAILVAHDVRMQYRYGIYAAYGVVIALYAGVLISAGAWLPRWVPALIIFTDPAALGFFFLGALMMLERAEGVRTALATTPVTAADYLLGKLITLTVVSLVASGVLIAVRQEWEGAGLLFVAVALTAIQYIGIGVPIALKFRTVSDYLIGSAALLSPVIAPGLLAIAPDMPSWLLVIPSVSQMRLMLVGTGAASASATELAAMLAVSAIAAAVACWLALHFLRREFWR